MFIFQTINFTYPFYAPPVVVVTPKQGYMDNYSGVSRSQCNAMTAWVEVSYQCCNAFDKDSLVKSNWNRVSFADNKCKTV